MISPKQLNTVRAVFLSFEEIVELVRSFKRCGRKLFWIMNWELDKCWSMFGVNSSRSSLSIFRRVRIPMGGMLIRTLKGSLKLVWF
jgi:hypothetical protein